MGGTDIAPLGERGVPLLGLDVEGSRYFDYHHSVADTLGKVDPKELAMNVATVAVVAYVLADLT
jgi:carboxypeptidase Q